MRMNVTHPSLMNDSSILLNNTYSITNITVDGEALVVTNPNASIHAFASHSVSPVREKHPAYVAGEFLHRWVAPMVQGVSAAIEWFTDSHTESSQSSLGADAKLSASTDPMLSSTVHTLAAASTAEAIDLGALVPGQGLVLNGALSGDYAGRSVSGAGDVNGDGINDLIVGAEGASPLGRNAAGQAVVIFGGSSLSTQGSMDLGALAPSQGLILNGSQAGDFAGFSVSNAGDVNGDGIDDLVVGAEGASPPGGTLAGQAYVIFGNRSLTALGSVDLGALAPSQGLVINGIRDGDGAGSSVSGAGDVNGDGIDDLIIGAEGANTLAGFNAGQAYVIFGGAYLRTAGSIDLRSLTSGQGLALNGAQEDDRTGWSVSSAGDVNSDGIDDLIVGAYRADPLGRTLAGQAAVIFGGSSLTTQGSVDLGALAPNQGLILNGAQAGDLAGFSVSNAGDVNGDRIDDLIVGAFRASQAVVVFGQVPTRAPTITWFPTLSPTTVNPTQMQMPTTVSPVTFSPTESPTSSSPTSVYPTTTQPTTLSPHTREPSRTPTTGHPTTWSPHTREPSRMPITHVPTTGHPTTDAPTTQAPITEVPTMSPTGTASSAAASTSTSMSMILLTGVGTALGAILLCLGGCCIHRSHYQGKRRQQINPLANALQQKLKLYGVGTFDTWAGHALMRWVEQVTSSQQWSHGSLEEINGSLPEVIDSIATLLANAIKQRYPSAKAGYWYLGTANCRVNVTAIQSWCLFSACVSSGLGPKDWEQLQQEEMISAIAQATVLGGNRRHHHLASSMGEVSSLEMMSPRDDRVADKKQPVHRRVSSLVATSNHLFRSSGIGMREKSENIPLDASPRDNDLHIVTTQSMGGR